MDKNKLYYLCHPYTSYGDKEANKQDSIETEKVLKEVYEVNIINPLVLINTDDNEEAMEKCMSLLSACDAIILCPDWNKSQGCKEEVSFAAIAEMEIVMLNNIL